MFSAKTATRFAGATIAAVALAASSAAMAGVVVKSSGPSSSKYPVGKKLKDDAVVVLKSGDSLTVLTSKGTRVMRGEGTYKVGDNPTATRARFAALTRKRAARRVRTGAVRGSGAGATEARPLSPNLWYVDVSQSGAMCVYDTSAVRLWRPVNDGIATYRIVDTSSQSSIDVTFDDGAAIAALDPARMTITPGTSYTLAGPEGTNTSTITFAQLETEYDSADQLAEALIEAGCMSQVSLLADRLGA